LLKTENLDLPTHPTHQLPKLWRPQPNREFPKPQGVDLGAMALLSRQYSLLGMSPWKTNLLSHYTNFIQTAASFGAVPSNHNPISEALHPDGLLQTPQNQTRVCV